MSARCRACNRITLGKCEHCRLSYCQEHLLDRVCRGCEQIRHAVCQVELHSKNKVMLSIDELEISLSCAQALKLQKALDLKAAEIRAALDNRELAPQWFDHDW